MNYGIKEENKKTYCKNCNRELNIKIPDEIFNFCPFCNFPLNIVAYNIVKEKERQIKLEVINDLANEFKSVDSLNVLKSYLNKINIE